ncbi:hypothetical protein JOL62DRAFT_205315 [Phyllosticta paracitricarpa]|uniref:Uncharacterized protein n=2 Tax=Phyllosticta TaxID=121621 RepID=A0ABR1MD98_9PEZI
MRCQKTSTVQWPRIGGDNDPQCWRTAVRSIPGETSWDKKKAAGSGLIKRSQAKAMTQGLTYRKASQVTWEPVAILCTLLHRQTPKSTQPFCLAGLGAWADRAEGEQAGRALVGSRKRNPSPGQGSLTVLWPRLGLARQSPQTDIMDRPSFCPLRGKMVPFERYRPGPCRCMDEATRSRLLAIKLDTSRRSNVCPMVELPR